MQQAPHEAQVVTKPTWKRAFCQPTPTYGIIISLSPSLSFNFCIFPVDLLDCKSKPGRIKARSKWADHLTNLTMGPTWSNMVQHGPTAILRHLRGIGTGRGQTRPSSGKVALTVGPGPRAFESFWGPYHCIPQSLSWHDLFFNGAFHKNITFAKLQEHISDWTQRC